MKKFALFIIVLSVLAILFYHHDENENVTQTKTQPSISYIDILHNPEFKHGIMQAVSAKDDALLKSLQAKALEIAEAANLSEQEISLFAGTKGEGFIRFHGSRFLFWQNVEQRYRNLTDIEDLKTQYPQAQDLFSKADALLEKRNDLLSQMVEEYRIAGIENPEDAARHNWLAVHTNQI
ncbi:hypothetical protein OE749_10840 [Aestuariibacter sp. AA17]|uniref:Uncharacterized protein n=1 Tax=Fluctibacter corallii TaxID=2984329 RepID=A0ABT3AA81_9ALTE|nr:hypothetical protein [Aestuariibacter sp. AA17]MCV2885187.1 hypothetical protein [Aestuariibacter sp. AA17]